MAKSQIESHRIATFNLGEKGVVITKSPVHGEDGELAAAQNAVPNPEGGLSGIRKRIGFQALNDTAAAGAILAFISLNLEDPGVIAVNPAAFGRWLYSTDGGATWAYLEVQQSVADPADIPVNYDSIDRVGFLHTLVDTDKTGLVAVDQVASLNVWEESAVPAEGFDPGRVPYPIPHQIDLADGYLYYWGADGTTVRRWGNGTDEELTDFGTDITGIVDWGTDGVDLYLLCTYAPGGGYPDGQKVYKITVSDGTYAQVGAIITTTGATMDGTYKWYRQMFSLCVIDLNGDTPTLVVGGSSWYYSAETFEWTQAGLLLKVACDANNAAAWTDVISIIDYKDVPTGNAYATLTAQALCPTPPTGSGYSPGNIVQFGNGDTITIGDITYTAVNETTPANANEFFRGGVWAYDPGGELTNGVGGVWDPNTASWRTPPSYSYRDGLYCLAQAVLGTVETYDPLTNVWGNIGVGPGTVANPLVTSSRGATWLTVTARASGASGNGIAVAETSAIAAWDGATLSHGVYTTQARTGKVKVNDILNDATKGILWVCTASSGGHAEIKELPYPLTAGAWSPALTDKRTMQYPFGYIGVWGDNDELLFLETPEAITLQLAKGVLVDAAIFFLIGTGIETDATINLIALSAGALQRIELPS